MIESGDLTQGDATVTEGNGRAVRRGLQPLTWVVLVLAVGVTVAGSLAMRGVVHDQARRLLQQRAEEASVYLSSVIGSAEQATLGQVVESPDPAGAGRADFEQRARGLLALANYKAVALVRASDDTVVAAEGAGLAVGTRLDPARAAAVAALAQRSGAGALPFAATQVFQVGGTPRLGLAYAPAVAPAYVVYAEAEVNPFAPQQTTSGQPFAELQAEVYAVPHRDRSQLLISSVPKSQYPMTGLTASFASAVGSTGQKWLLVARARQSLVGSVAESAPWALLLGGLLATALVAWTIELLARRRRYALDLVAERTAELEASLAELSATQRQLVRQERLAAIGELASTIGHELRNPLGVLSNALYLVRNDLGAAISERSRRHLATAEREVSAASVIVSDLLEFARAREPVPVEFDVNGLVDEVLSVSPPPSGVGVERAGDAGPVPLTADRDQLRQVLLNLVGNAVQAMPDGGTLRVAVEPMAGAVRVRVADTGTGMTDEVRAQVFEPFFTTKARGVGLGLAVTRRIVESHGGEVTVDSAPGQGTTFTVTLPQVAAPRRSVDALAPGGVSA